MSGRIRALLGVTAGITIVAAAITFLVVAIVLPNRVVIRNDSGRDLHSIRLTIRDFQGRLILGKSLLTLSPRESVAYRHSANNTLEAELQFTLAGHAYSYQDSIDLWTGEGWMLVINSDGGVLSTYEGLEARHGSR
jgi:hypothetical protein